MSKQPEPNVPVPEELVAYLDRELDAQASRRIDELLARNDAVRDEVHRLERVWNLLDELPRAEVDESFTHSTVSLIAMSADQQAQKEQALSPRRRFSRRLAAGASLAAACLFGFLAVNWFLPNPNEQLLKDLPVLERLDQYSQVGDIEFLRLLDRENVFPPESDDAM